MKLKLPTRGVFWSSLTPAFEDGVAEEFKKELNYLAEWKTPYAAFLIGIVTYQGKLDQIKELVPGWTAPDPEKLKKCLEGFNDWYIKQARGTIEQTVEWAQNWDQTFFSHTGT